MTRYVAELHRNGQPTASRVVGEEELGFMVWWHRYDPDHAPSLPLPPSWPEPIRRSVCAGFDFVAASRMKLLSITRRSGRQAGPSPGPVPTRAHLAGSPDLYWALYEQALSTMPSSPRPLHHGEEGHGRHGDAFCFSCVRADRPAPDPWLRPRGTGRSDPNSPAELHFSFRTEVTAKHHRQRSFFGLAAVVLRMRRKSDRVALEGFFHANLDDEPVHLTLDAVTSGFRCDLRAFTPERTSLVGRR
ncbi:MAG: hypothetical protein AAF928_01730 [Myxococcota bacterium]